MKRYSGLRPKGKGGAPGNAGAEAALREWAEKNLAVAIETIRALEGALSRLAGPQFGLLLGATYDPRSRGSAILTALQATFQ